MYYIFFLVFAQFARVTETDCTGYESELEGKCKKQEIVERIFNILLLMINHTFLH